MELRNQNPGPNGMKCADFDARLADALDGVLSPAEVEVFNAHAAACADCSPLFTQTLHGMESLKSLAAFELEPPLNLVHNILAKTSMVDPAMAPGLASTQASWQLRLREWAAPFLRPVLHLMNQPRLAMTTAMAFFSVSLVLNLAGVKVGDFRRLDLRPSAITTTASVQYHQTTAKVVKYYENIRFVYELQSRMKELTKDATPPADQKKSDRKPRPKNDNTSHNPETNRNYRADKDEEYLARLHNKLDLYPGHGRSQQNRRLA